MNREVRGYNSRSGRKRWGADRRDKELGQGGKRGEEEGN